MRILVAEDLYLLRDGMVRLIEAYGHQVVATATTGPETLHALLTWRPDVAVVDVRMPRPSRTRACGRLLPLVANCPDCPS